MNMKINSIILNNKICRFKGTLERNQQMPENKYEFPEVRINDYAVAMPKDVLRNEISRSRREMLPPVSDYKEYCRLKEEIFKYKDLPKRNMLIPPFIQEFGYEKVDDNLKGLVCYCGAEDKSNIINSWLTARPLPKNLAVDDEQISKIIRVMDYSLKRLDDKFGEYKGIVYRNGYFNPLTDKQFYSSSSQSINAIRHGNNYLPAEDNQYSIILLKNGHNINEFQKSANSFIAKKYAETENEILIDRHSVFRLVPEYKYSEETKILQAVLLAQSLKKDDDINENDIQKALKNHSDLLKYISVWEEI